MKRFSTYTFKNKKVGNTTLNGQYMLTDEGLFHLPKSQEGLRFRQWRKCKPSTLVAALTVE